VNEDLVPLPAASVRARRRPWVVVGLWAWQTVLALLAARPAVSLVRAAYGDDPRGDAPLWRPGALPLLDLLARDAHGAAAALGTADAALAVAAVAGLVPTAAAMVAMSYGGRGRPSVGTARALAGGVRALPAFALMFALVGVAQGLLAAAAVAVADVVEAWAHTGLGEARAQQLGVAAAAPCVVAVAALGVMHDVARAGVVRLRLRGFRALTAGVRALREAPVALGWSWTWRATASCLAVVAAALAVGPLGGRGGAALVFVAVLHQAVVVGRVAFRTSWLARALRAVAAHDATSER